ncbi:hypothetical protein TNCV_2474151 [Trichonephila clavipes]|nr:hypothetical protein TNCV_2474151 [Trichonephila clavipes]
MSSIPVPPKTRRVGQRCTLNLSRAETSSRWCGVVVRRGGASSGLILQGVAEFDRQTQRDDSRQHKNDKSPLNMGSQTTFNRSIVNHKNCYEGCDVEWNKKGNKSYRRLTHKRFQLVPEEDILIVEVWEAWRPSNKFNASNLSPGISSTEVVTLRNRKKCASALSYMNHMFWYYKSSPYKSEISAKFAYVQISSTLPGCSKSPHLFGHTSRLAHPPPEGYYHPNFDRPNGVCDPVFYGDLSSPCCLLLPL